MNGRNMILAVARQCTRGLLLSFGLSAAASVLMLAAPIYMIQVFDRVLSSRSLSTLAWLTVIAIAAFAAHGLLDYARARLHQLMGLWMNRRLGLESLAPIVRRTLRGKGDPRQALQDVQELRGFVAGRAIPSALEALLTPLFILVLFLLHPWYAAVAVVGALVMVAIAVVNEVATYRVIRKANESASRGTGVLAGALRHSEVIEGMGMMPAILNRWWAVNQEALEHAEAAGRRSAVISALSAKLTQVIHISVIGIGAVLVIEHMATPGTVFAAMVISGLALRPFQQLIDGWKQWVGAYAAIQRLRDLFGEGEANRSTTDLPVPNGALEVERLVFVPPGQSRAVLKGISFRVEPGQAVAILGNSAAGKSSLARLLVGVWPPTAGSVRLDGHDVYSWDRESFGRYVGYMPQSGALFDGTIRENIARLGDEDPRDVVAAAKRAGVHEIVGRLPFGYDTPVGEGSYLLTGGQRQRIALARALFGRPRLLVLDEPDTSLDSAGEQALIAAIRNAKAEGAIIVVVTHRQEVLKAVDRILVLRDGQIERIEDRGAASAAEGAPRAIGARREAVRPVASLPPADRKGDS